MIEITINADRNRVTIAVDGEIKKMCRGDAEFCFSTAQRWAKQYEVKQIILESKF